MAEPFDVHRSWIAREFGLRDFLPLHEEDLDALARIGTVERYDESSPIFRQGEQAIAAYLIRAGEVGLWRDRKRPTVQLALVGPGRIVGDVEMFTEGERFSTAIASTPVTALRLPREAVMQVLVEHPRLTVRWLVAALQQFEASQRRITQLLVRSARAKVAMFLLDEADDGGRVRITHEQVARLLGLERATVSRVLERMRDERLVEKGRGWILILDPDGLTVVANGIWPNPEGPEGAA